MVDTAALILVVVALAFAWSIGAHYTGACMGMAYAAGAIRRQSALLGMAALTFVGAAIASSRVVENIGLNLIPGGALTTVAAAAVVATSFGLTTAYNWVKVPTSTIQIFVFSLIGVALAAGIRVNWTVLGGLVVLWVVAPIAALGLGYAFTRLFSRERTRPERPLVGSPRLTTAAPWLVMMGLAASFAMGANDVANATAVFVSTGLTSVVVAGAVGGVALAVGVLTWGGRLLSAVAFDIVKVDTAMATAAQLAQASVILAAVLAAGAFTSMNQSLVGGMAGAGIARGRSTIRPGVVRGILVAWALGPVSGLAGGLAVAIVLAAFGLPI